MSGFARWLRKGQNMLCALTMATLLAACGQKGPLYLPGENRSATQPPSTAWYCASTPEQPHCGGS